MVERDDSEEDREPSELDDVEHREELRQRYYGLLQELRVIQPGVQVLLAFLLTAPFAQRFSELDDVGERAYLIALLSTLGSVTCLLTPTVFHRVADRTARGARLEWGVRLTLVGVALLAVALTAASWCVTRLVFGTTTAHAVAAAAVFVFVSLWLALPTITGRQSQRRQDER